MATDGRPGMGVLIKMMGGNEETVEAVKGSLGKTITSVAIEQEDGRYRSMGENRGDTLVLRFNDDTGLRLWDGGQSCCEERYMNCDDDLAYFAGATFTDVEVRDAPNEEDEYGVHEVQFLVVQTSKGAFTIANHNEHNGYYGGFWMQAAPLAARRDMGGDE